jgi:hypothetical protein
MIACTMRLADTNIDQGDNSRRPTVTALAGELVEGLTRVHRRQRAAFLILSLADTCRSYRLLGIAAGNKIRRTRERSSVQVDALQIYRFSS